jgi:hypothetical protein
MSEMIDKVAMAIFAAANAAGGDYGEWCSRDMANAAARAAIEAMREPTREMQAAVENDDVIQCGLDDCNKHGIPDDAWRLMIDAALGKVDA